MTRMDATCLSDVTLCRSTMSRSSSAASWMHFACSQNWRVKLISGGIRRLNRLKAMVVCETVGDGR